MRARSAGRWGTVKSLEWIRWSDEEQMVGVMIEDHRTMERARGASDFSVSIGHPGQSSHPKIMDALKKTIRAADRHGKWVCKGVGYPWVENAKKFVEMGCHMIELGHDATILRTIWTMKGEEIRKLK